MCTALYAHWVRTHFRGIGRSDQKQTEPSSTGAGITEVQTNRLSLKKYWICCRAATPGCGTVLKSTAFRQRRGKYNRVQKSSTNERCLFSSGARMFGYAG